MMESPMICSTIWDPCSLQYWHFFGNRLTTLKKRWLISNYFTGEINPVILENNYVELLGRRAFAFFWIMSAFNLSFYFGVSFRFVTSVVLMYTVNATFDQFLIMYDHYNVGDIPMFSAFFFSRPILILALILALKSYKDE